MTGARETTGDLVAAFLQARLDEREDTAKRAVFGWGPEWTVRRHEDDEEWSSVDADGMRDMVSSGDVDVTRHIALHDPAAVLRDTAALRALIAVVESWQHRADSDAWVFCPLAPETRRRFPDDWDDGGARCTCGRDRQVLAVLGPFAAVHATHPDYRPEWKPTGAAGVWW